MKLVGTKSIEPGAILAQSIYNENGIVLIAKGMELTRNIIKRLNNYGITYVYIEDDLSKGIIVDSFISDRVRREALNTVKSIFTDIKNKGINNSTFILDKKGKELQNVIENLMLETKNNEKPLSFLADIYLTDNYVFHHSLNVTIYTLAIGVKLNLPNQKLMELGLGALLHDIGKIFVDQDVLQKPGRLTDEEFEIIKEHAQIGYDFLRKQMDISSVVAHCALEHHERLDGSGYPRSLRGDEIHLYAKIIGIADVFDAVTSNRVYRDAMLPHEGLEILYSGAVNLFDKEMVEAFKKSIVVYPDGISVELSDGRKGIVARQNKHLCDRPVIRIIYDKDRQVDTPYEVDLSNVMNIMVVSVLKD
ncbi:HD-GYP domain-containing protein [Oceanobacillus bengalensis]|uniref:HD-GYP domain-containing protein n=1 Tax=Oceanobacillus bengalensis TaxID=1435466 RepID=A0A494YRJ2_9BACI|nr:HD-GYP domain-containing protein [Oceanobacillus bengalensis]RKQ11971.1 HD-GYP domain-containing protein [Oceanobacillus bengalensis]